MKTIILDRINFNNNYTFYQYKSYYEQLGYKVIIYKI